MTARPISEMPVDCGPTRGHNRPGPRGGVLVLTDRLQASRPLPEVVAAALAGGAHWVLLRERDLPRAERAALAARLREILAPVEGRLLVAGPDPLGGDAVHLAASDPDAQEVLRSGGRPAKVGLVGRSCHSAVEIDRLTVEDYLTVSPVFESTSKPGYGPALGTGGLAALCRHAHPRPVLALGGVETPERAAACIAAGAAGVAVMGAVMRAADPAAVTREMCTAWSRQSGPPGGLTADRRDRPGPASR